MEQIIEEYMNTPIDDRDFSELAYSLMKYIFNRLPEEKKWVREMSDGRWEDYVAEQLKNTSLSESRQDAVHDFTTSFWGDYFYDE